MLETCEAQFDSAFKLSLQRNYRSSRGIQATAASLIAPDAAGIQAVVCGGTGEGSGGARTQWAGVCVGAFTMPTMEAAAVAGEPRALPEP